MGDTIYARVEVIGAKAMRWLGDRLVRLAITLYNQHEEIVQAGTWKVLLHSRTSVRQSC